MAGLLQNFPGLSPVLGQNNLAFRGEHLLQQSPKQSIVFSYQDLHDCTA